MGKIVAWLAAFALIGTGTAAPPVLPSYPEVRPGVALTFPRDHGAHPAYRTEWWYVTGWLKGADGSPFGFQVTFFQSRLAIDQRNPSRFAPRHVLFAHAALSDAKGGRMLHDQRAARAGFGLARAATSNTDLRLQNWTLKRLPDGRFRTRIPAAGFMLDLEFRPTQPPLLQGQAGYSRKGPLSSQASYYYSIPHLAVSGNVANGKRNVAVTGTAWLDREWSSTLLDPRAVGWDWTGLHLDDGSALMAFRVRDARGASIWAGGSLRRPDGRVTSLAPGDVRFQVRRRWRSPRTGAVYPVEQLLSVRLPEGIRTYPLAPMFNDQELDGRSGAMPTYWEGAVRTRGGCGYLELTGYAAPIRM